MKIVKTNWNVFDSKYVQQCINKVSVSYTCIFVNELVPLYGYCVAGRQLCYDCNNNNLGFYLSRVPRSFFQNNNNAFTSALNLCREIKQIKRLGGEEHYYYDDYC